jgi:hypothetical protein
MVAAARAMPPDSAILQIAQIDDQADGEEHKPPYHCFLDPIV